MSITPTHYDEQAYGQPYREDLRAMSPNGLDAAGNFVHAFSLWAGHEERGGTEYRAQLKKTAHLFETFAAVEQTHIANAYKHAARQLRALARDHNHTADRYNTTAAARTLAEVLRGQALTEHRRHTERAREYNADREDWTRLIAEAHARAHLKRATDQDRPTT